MSFLAEIAIAVVFGLIQLTIAAAEFAWRPIKFLLRPSYRADVLQRRHTAPKRFWFQITSGVLALALLAFLITGWSYFIFAPDTESRETSELESKVTNWLKDHAVERYNSKKAAEQGAAANP